jgi:protein-S-isoprenylcysteine O-methyltransferase Ste14
MRTLLLPPIAVLACAGLMALLHRFSPLATWLPTPWNWLGLVPVIGGLALAQWHARMFRRVGTNINTFGEPGTLRTEGLFRRTRNPMYLGMLIALLGLAATLGSASALAGPLLFFALAQFFYVPTEERAMAQKFGPAYDDYRRRVPRWW